MSKKSLLSKVFNKSKPLSNQVSHQVQLPEKKIPRTKDQINLEYQQLCTTMGDKIVKKEGLDLEIKALFKHVESLGNELTARETLDKDQAQSSVETPSSGNITANQTDSQDSNATPQQASV